MEREQLFLSNQKSPCRNSGSWDSGWDEDVPSETRKKWVKLFEEINALNDVKFDRCLTPEHAAGDPMLVVFCDASRLAFGTCAYARWELQDGKFNARFIAAKSRVAPLKELTIPRLELQAAVSASCLGKSILEESRLKFERGTLLVRQQSCVGLDSRSISKLQALCVRSSRRNTRQFKTF